MRIFKERTRLTGKGRSPQSFTWKDVPLLPWEPVTSSPAFREASIFYLRLLWPRFSFRGTACVLVWNTIRSAGGHAAALLSASVRPKAMQSRSAHPLQHTLHCIDSVLPETFNLQTETAHTLKCTQSNQVTWKQQVLIQESRGKGIVRLRSGFLHRTRVCYRTGTTFWWFMGTNTSIINISSQSSGKQRDFRLERLNLWSQEHTGKSMVHPVKLHTWSSADHWTLPLTSL